MSESFKLTEVIRWDNDGSINVYIQIPPKIREIEFDVIFEDHLTRTEKENERNS